MNVRTDTAQCPHSDLDIKFHLTTMVDSNVGSFALSARCKICDRPMNFARGLPMGATSRGPTRDSSPECRGGVLIPMIADGDDPTKEWGVTLSGPHIITNGEAA
jgi:hypothetical protein